MKHICMMTTVIKTAKCDIELMNDLLESLSNFGIFRNGCSTDRRANSTCSSQIEEMQLFVLLPFVVLYPSKEKCDLHSSSLT